MARALLALMLAVTTLVPQAQPVLAQSGERTLYLYYTHTRETARITFKRNGQYIQSGLRELNQFLRDWRRDEPANMDPRLFDLVWEVYQEVGATQPINIVSAYRAPETNAMLRSRSSGVAENSKHMQGQAMDFFIPGIPLNRLRAVAMRKQVGGVGYYPTSGSPFVHLDTGNVRAWPRMTKAQLEEIFPDGRTLHLPPSGKPLSQQGYQMARAEWQKCHQVPCGGSGNFAVASHDGSGRSLMDVIFGGGGSSSNKSEPQVTQVAAVAPSRAAANEGPKVAPIPMLRPAAFGGAEPADIPFSSTGSEPLDPAEMAVANLAPVPAIKSEELATETGTDETAVMAIAALDAPVPAPRILMSERTEGDIVTAYAPDAQNALETIIERATSATETAATPAPAATEDAEPELRLAGLSAMKTGSLVSGTTTQAVASLFEGTWGIVQDQQAPAPIAQALEDMVSRPAEPATPPELAMREPELIAPDLDHVVQTLLRPVSVSSSHYAVIFEHDEADFDPATELGTQVPVMGVGDEPPLLSADSFAPARPLIVASR